MEKKYKFVVNQVIDDVKFGRLKILNKTKIENAKGYKSKGYEYECLVCGNKDRILESSLNINRGCNVCCIPSRKILKGYNDLRTTHPQIARLLKKQERGCFLTKGSNQREEFRCKKCEYERTLKVCDVVRYGFSCMCSDGISYPEKFVMNLLSQLKIEFEKEKIFSWSKDSTSFKRYDFYIPSIECIIETHGEQHYFNRFNKHKEYRRRDFKEEKENDVYKQRLAIKNGILNYVIIDCRKSSLNYIKFNILNSKLSELYNLENINWLQCHKYACSSLVREACSIWGNGIINTVEIGNKLNLSRSTIISYLKQGNILGWCHYDPKQAMVESNSANAKINGKLKRKRVIQLSLSNEFVNEWESATEAAKKMNTSQGSISRTCRGERQKCHGYKWMYKEDYEKYIAEQNKELVLT
jgi:hypothetical protein